MLGVLTYLMMMLSLPWEAWLRLAAWLAIGLAIYYGYGRQHSKLRQAREAEQTL